MGSKLKFIELNYYCHDEYDNAELVIQKHLPSNLFATPFLKYADVWLVKHMNFEGEREKDGIHYKFFKRRNSFTHVPFPAHRFIKEQRPDIVLVQGFIFPIQVIFLRKKIGKHPTILLQHHGELPERKKVLFQKLADKFVDGYIFSATGNAIPWLNAGIIKDQRKCFEMPQSSTFFSNKNKSTARKTTRMNEGIQFLWVGRLNKNKDPITVLRAFEKYAIAEPGSFLNMLFNEADLLKEIEKLISNSTFLAERVRLVGNRPHAEMENWYNAADYYISASWNEGGSYALTEAMACGCIPIVSNIPPSMNAIGNGDYGYYFEPGDSEGLYRLLSQLDHSTIEAFSKKVVDRFNQALSPSSIAEKLYTICNELRTSKTINT